MNFAKIRREIKKRYDISICNFNLEIVSDSLMSVSFDMLIKHGDALYVCFLVRSYKDLMAKLERFLIERGHYILTERGNKIYLKRSDDI